MLYSLCECSQNILKGNVKLTPAQKRRLVKSKDTLRKLSDRRVKQTQKQRLVQQRGGFIGALLSAIAPVLGSLLIR